MDQPYQKHQIILYYQKTRNKGLCSKYQYEWCPLPDSNRPPTDYKSVALPNELKGLINILIILHYKPICVYRLNVHRAAYTHGKGLSGIFVQSIYYHVNLTYLGCKKYISKLTMRDKIHLIKHSKKLAESKKEKALFRSQRQPVEAGAYGTLDYTIKKGVNKNKIANSNIIKSK